MGFFKNCFKTAGEFAAISSQLVFQENRAVTAEWKCEQLEKELKAERKRFDKVQAAFMDYVAKSTGVQGKFSAVQQEKEPEVPEQLTLYEENKLEWVAKQMMQADIDEGREVQPFYVYLDAVKANPSRYSEIN